MTITRNTTGTYTATQRAQCGRLIVAEDPDRHGAMLAAYRMVMQRNVEAMRWSR